MKIIMLVLVLMLSNLKSNSQVTNISNYNELINFQKHIGSETKTAILWGYFGNWGKYTNVHQFNCKSSLKSGEFSKINSCLSFRLFSDSVAYYLPVKQDLVIPANYKTGDLIKLKIKLYKNCTSINEKIFFLIEEIL